MTRCKCGANEQAGSPRKLCVDNRCGCVKGRRRCQESCKCQNLTCKNPKNRQTRCNCGAKDEAGSPRKLCVNNRCGCVKGHRRCQESCKCPNINCKNRQENESSANVPGPSRDQARFGFLDDLFGCLGQIQTPRPDLPETTCISCEKTIGKGVNRLICTDCTSPFHKKCSDFNTGVTKSHFKNNTWRCKPCTGKDLPTYQPFMISDLATNELTILQWNANGITTKISELSTRAVYHKADIIIIQESKLNKNVLNSDIRIKGYQDPGKVRADRPGGRGGGGLITYIRNGIQVEEIPLNKAPSNKNMEAQAISVQQNENPHNETSWLNITNFYIPPHTEYTTSDLDCLPIISNKSNRSIIAGDFNAHHTDWDKYQPVNNQGTVVVAWTKTKKNNLYICNVDKTPTRTNKGKGKSKATGGLSAPDVTIASTNLKQDVEWSVDSEDLGSDHFPIIIKVKPPP